MKYKEGDKVKIKSYMQLKKQIENGLEFKSKQFYTNVHREMIFCIQKYEIDNIQDKELVIDRVYDNDVLSFKNTVGLFPFEFIKTEFKLPDELFEL